jgi:hypothetical protein
MTAKILPFKKNPPSLFMTVVTVIGMPIFMVAVAVWAIFTVLVLLPFAAAFSIGDVLNSYLEG